VITSKKEMELLFDEFLLATINREPDNLIYLVKNEKVQILNRNRHLGQ